MAEVKSLAATGVTLASMHQWVDTQMSLPPTSHRAYYRERSNPEAPDSTTSAPGGARLPCDVGSVWSESAFAVKDRGKGVAVTQAGSRYGLWIDGALRTEMANTTFQSPGVTSPDIHTINSELDRPVSCIADLVFQNLTLKLVDGHLGGRIVLQTGEIGPSALSYYITIQGGNPSIQLSAPDLQRTLAFESGDASLVPYPQRAPYGGLFVLSALNVECPAMVLKHPAIHFMGLNGKLYRHDARVRTLENTREKPSSENRTSTQSCPAVARSFLNRKSGYACKRQASCAPLAFNSAQFVLNATMIRKFFLYGGRFVYYIDGLRQEGSHAKDPCGGSTSRWRRTPGACSGGDSVFADTATKNLILSALNASTDSANGFLRDVNLNNYKKANGGSCTVTSNHKVMGSRVTFQGECFENVHHQLYNVYDFSDWVLYHQGLLLCCTIYELL